MVPIGDQETVRDKGTLFADPRPLLQQTKTSKYSSEILVTYGWHPIDSKVWKTTREYGYRMAGPVDVDPPDQFAWRHDLSAEVTRSKEGHITSMSASVNKAEFDAAVQSMTKEAEAPPVDDMYFDLDNYLRHAEGPQQKQNKEWSPNLLQENKYADVEL
jgi:hypothetical protein